MVLIETIGWHAVLGTLVNFSLDMPLVSVASTGLVTAFVFRVTCLLDLCAHRAGYSPLRLDLAISYLLLTFSDSASPAIITPIPVLLAQCLYQCGKPSCDVRAYRAT